MNPPPFARALLGAATAGVLYGVAQVGFGFWPLVFACLAGLWLAQARVGPARAAALGATFGFVAHAVAMGWLLPTIARFAGSEDAMGVGIALWTAHGLWVAAGFAIASALTCVLRGRDAPWWIAGPAPLVLVEWAQPQVRSRFT